MALNSTPDTTTTLEQALSRRLRRAVRYVAGGATLFVGFATISDLLWPLGLDRAQRIGRWLLLAAVVLLLRLAKEDASYRRMLVLGVLTPTAGIAHVLISIGSSGGALSSQIALFPITVAATAFVMVVPPRLAAVVYGLWFAAYVATLQACTPAAATAFEMRGAIRFGVLSVVIGNLGVLLSYRQVRDTFAWRMALAEESRRSTLALERTRIARDLHDHIGARLTGIALRAERVSKSVPEPAQEALRWIQGTSAVCLEEIRDTIWALSSTAHEASELVAVLRRRAEDFADSSALQLEWRSSDRPLTGQVSAGASVAVSAILREALTNVARHSGARSIAVALAVDASEIALEVTDDGCGLGSAPSTGRGFTNMRARAQEQGGQVEIADATPGVRVRARVPVA